MNGCSGRVQGRYCGRRFVGRRVRCWHRLRREGRGFFEDEAVVVLRPVADVARHLEAGGGHLGDDRPLLDAMARRRLGSIEFAVDERESSADVNLVEQLSSHREPIQGNRGTSSG